MPPEELQRRSADERAKTLLAQIAGVRRCNWHTLKTAVNATGVLAKSVIEADVFFGFARMLDDPAHRETLRKLGRDEQAAAVRQTLLVEVPGPVVEDVDAALTRELGLRRHTYAKNSSGVWVYRGDAVLPDVEDLVGPLGGTVTPTRHGEVKATADSEAPTSPSDPTHVATRADRAADVPLEDVDARSEASGVDESPTVEIADASAPSSAGGEADPNTTTGGTSVKRDESRDVAGEPKGAVRHANEAARSVSNPRSASPGCDAKLGALAQADASRSRQDTVGKQIASMPLSRNAAELTNLEKATSVDVKEARDTPVIPDFMKGPDTEGVVPARRG